MDYSGNANANYTITLGSDNWNQTVTLKGKVIYTKNPKVILGGKMSVQLKTKGNINLVNSNEYVTITPILKNTTAKVENIKLTETEYADKFRIETLGNGAFKLAYDDEVVASLEAKQYSLAVKVILDDGNEVDYTLKVKTVIKLPKVKADITKGTLYNGSKKAVTANLTTISNTGANAIDRIEIVNNPNFKVDFTPNKFDASNATVNISLENANVAAGKYTVICAVYYETGATDETPVNVKFTITVK
jgi:hypothetical protein